ncbi:MAG: hypothetical protein N3F09_05285 [Bacteroidia bacterium]|nr:hypothetical protein [Bacteroidia bacterium]
MMFSKKILFLFFLFFFASCKKERVCICSVSDSGKSTTTAQITIEVAPPPAPPLPLFDTSFTTEFYETDYREIKYTNTTRRKAKLNCVSYKEPYRESNYNSVPNFSLITTKEGIRTYDCRLK